MSLPRILLMLAVVITVFGGIHFYLGARLVSLQVLSRPAVFPLLASLAISMLAALFLAHTGSSSQRLPATPSRSSP